MPSRGFVPCFEVFAAKGAVLSVGPVPSSVYFGCCMLALLLMGMVVILAGRARGPLVLFMWVPPEMPEGAASKVSDPFACLTPREREVALLLSEGKTPLAVQEHLCISDNTVRMHRKNIYRKLDVHSQQELIERVRSV